METLKKNQLDVSNGYHSCDMPFEEKYSAANTQNTCMKET
jgi:hypothetical protein